MKKRKLNQFYLLCTMVLSPLLFGCNSDKPISTDIVAPQYQPNTVNIGYLVGSVVHLRNSSLLAEQQINQAGGVLGQNFNVIILQSENPETSAEKAVDLMDNFDIELLMVTTSSRTLSVIEQAAPREVVVISETGTSAVLTDVDDNDYLFRTAPSDVYQGRMLAGLAHQEGALTASIVINKNDAYGSGMVKEFTRAFLGLGGNVLNVVEIPEQIGIDFGEYVVKAYAMDPDTVILAMLGGAINAQFVNESIGKGFNGFYLLPDTAVGVDFTNNLASSDVIDKAIGVSPSFGVDTNPEFKYFKQSYQQTFGIAHQQFDPNVFDATIIAALAMEHAGLANQTDKPRGSMIRQSLRAIMNPPGVKIGPSQLAQALDLLRSGQEIDYVGAYSAVDFDVHGDLAGTLVYDIHRYDPQTGQISVIKQLFVEVPLMP